VETALIVDNPDLQPTFIVRFKDNQGVVKYAVADDGGTVFNSESILQFHTSGNRQIADFTIVARPNGNINSTTGRFAGKIFITEDRILARLGACRDGILRIKNEDYSIRIYAPSVNDPFYDLSTSAVCLIDLNRDGDYSWRWLLDDSTGDVIPSERVVLTKPFDVDGQKLKAASIDSTGTLFTCSDYPGDTAAVVGFMAPSFSVADLDGNVHSLADMKGHVVLITFWATHCGYCEKIRPQLDSLVAHSDPAQFQAISATVDTDSSAIANFLQTKPYGGFVVPLDEPLWNKYNPRRTTPVYYIIDRDGSIIFSGTGSSMFTVAERIIENKLASGK
jgi:thiol-disulfide isomerase/thioredoxin